MNSVEDTFLKRYFRAFAKPITLTLLFFTIVISLYYLVYAPDPSIVVIHYKPPEINQAELDRVSSLGSWLGNLFRGNLGISILTGDYVLTDLYPRLGFTLLLVGVSIAASVLTGMGLVFLSSFLKRRGLKPLTFAHSLNAYFFGLVSIIGIGILFLFLYLYEHGLYLRLPSPYYLGLYRRDILQPTLTLVLIALVRNIVVIRSRGSLFESKNRCKSLLLPITTIDFSFTISATLVIEILFGIPGLGKWFADSLLLTRADYNVTVAAFIMILVIAVCLGVASIPLDIIKRVSGLHEEFERKSAAKAKTNTRLLGNGWEFLKRKTFWMGLMIVVSFLLLAALAPWITGGIDPEQRTPAQRYAMPEWMALYNPAYQNLPRTTDYSLDWNWTLPLPEGITIQEIDNECKIRYEGNQSVVALLHANFHYLYDPPNSFYYQFKWGAKPGFVNGQATARYSLELNLTTPDGKVYPLWDQHWDKYCSKPCNVKNPNPPPTFYPGARDYMQKGYRVYEKYGWQIPTWETNQSDIFVHYTARQVALIRLGYKPWKDDEMTTDLFTPPGNNYTMQMFVTIKPTQPNALCEVTVTNLEVHVPGVLWGLLGTEHWGRDCWSRLVYGTGPMLAVVSLTAALAILIGSPLGFIAGYFENWPDNIVMALLDAILFMPVLPFTILITAFIGRQWFFISLIALPFLFPITTKAFRYSYLIRPSGQKLKGVSEENPALNFLRGILGNFCLVMVSVILLFFSMDFLGFGDPQLPSWGREYSFMQDVAISTLAQKWWWFLPPMIFTALLVLGFLLLGVSLDEERD